ncbi:glycerate kinase type-2 family protein [Spiribacter insolitus]|uniref:DUF4147 domain-containing protein n=1 Tax=Spiribacter insolitus TaxID=3122417 RepID=A0ABV3T4C9_9GAMM
MPSTPSRQDLVAFYRAALAGVNGRRAVASALEARGPGTPPPGAFHLLAIGKAASAMANGVADVRGEDVAGGLVITRAGYEDPRLPERIPVRQLLAAHPVPDARSLEAGNALVDYLRDAPADARFLFLISGGASSLVERPAGEQDPAALAQFNEWLLASGLDIARMNTLRKAVSTIKGGRLVRWLDGRRAHGLLISDVPGDDPAVIGSGLLAADRGTNPGGPLPASLPPGMTRASAPPDADIFDNVHLQIVASNAIARRACVDAARPGGWGVRVIDELLTGEAEQLGRRVAESVIDGPPGLVVMGGEPTVTLPEHPGRGGRMQTLALAAAESLAGSDCLLLAAGTDGADGPGEDAGAIVDGGTIQRLRRAGFDAALSLSRADAGSALAAAGDLLQTGPTGTNVMDLVIGFRP